MKFNPKDFFLIAGPCVAENQKICFQVAEKLQEIISEYKIQVIFKASYTKANRSSSDSYRGPGLQAGLKILESVKNKFGLPVITDIHETYEIDEIKHIVDFLQIPAFLSRQTELLEKAGESGLWVNIKKGQFLAPWDIKNAVKKVECTGNPKVLVTERGSSFGYNNLVIDYRGMILMLREKLNLVFDATHSVQTPSSQGKTSGGDRSLAPELAYAAATIGVKGFFFETHPNPEKALCDGPNSIYLRDMKKIVKNLISISDFRGKKID